MVDFVLYVLLALAQIVSAVWGGIVSVKSLPPDEKKLPHIWGFIALGILGFVLTAAVGVKNYQSQKANSIAQQNLQNDVHDSREDLKTTKQQLSDSRLAEEYMKGQLNGLSMMVGHLNDSGNSGMKEVAKVLNNMSQKPIEVHALSNKQLCDRTITFVKQLREFDTSWRYSPTTDEAWRQHMKAMNSAKTEEEREKEWKQYSANEMLRYQQREKDFQINFLGEAAFLRQELEHRIPSSPQPSEQERFAFSASSSVIAGPIGTYLEKLAKTLCP